MTDLTCNDIRQTLENGATLLEIASVLGHRSTSVTRRYAHLVQGAPVTAHAALDKKLQGK